MSVRGPRSAPDAKPIPRVTVYLGSFNRQARLEDSLKSISAQTLSDFEILITDNGSNPPLQLPNFARTDPRYQLVRLERNPERFTAPHELMRAFKTEYVALTCDDDAWHPEKLEKQVVFLADHPEIAACFTRVLPVDDQGAEFKDPPKHFLNIFEAPNRSRAQWVRQFFHHGNCVCYPSVVIRREVLEAILVKIPYIQLGDLFLWVRALKHGSIHILDEKLTRYRISSNGDQESGKSREKSSRIVYEFSRILHEFRALPTDIVIEAFSPTFPDDCIDEADQREFALFTEAMTNGSPPHLRFASELAESNFTARAMDLKTDSAIFWQGKYELATARVALKQSSKERVKRKLKRLFGL